MDMHNYFRAADFLLPADCDYQKWAVIACDQHTSEPEYWNQVKEYIGTAPSTLHVFFPEAELSTINSEDYDRYCTNMRNYLENQVFKEYSNSFIYVERTLENGSVRQGVVGVIDLEHYDYDPKPNTKIFATEATILQRVPPRVLLRNSASLEFSHTVIFCDDPACSIIEPIQQKRTDMELLYSFDLMYGGGHIEGYLMGSNEVAALEAAISEYESGNAYLVGDGNHSLVTAKLSYNALKAADPDTDWTNHPARFAMVELENIHNPAMVFEPIYRISQCTDPDGLIKDLQALDTAEGVPIQWFHADREGVVRLKLKDGMLPIEALQQFLEHWTTANDGSIDYIHGTETVRSLAQQPGIVGYLVPDLDKRMLFPYVLSGKVMPKKTFSIGHAAEKRYYLEGRKIK